jgi:hypothetical protein
MPLRQHQRVYIPKDRWTPVANKVFDETLATLNEKRSGTLYLILFDRCWHADGKRVDATIAEIAIWCDMDERTVVKCLRELRNKKLVLRVRKGVKRSHINKPRWRVPLAEGSRADGHYTPIPRFLIMKYCRRYPNALLLLVIIRYQHINWQNKAWVGVETLCKRTGWSGSRVRDAIRVMGHKALWAKQRIQLPWPLEITYHNRGQRRYLRVRAVWYEITGPKRRRFRKMFVSEEFRKRFKLPSRVPVNE